MHTLWVKERPAVQLSYIHVASITHTCISPSLPPFLLPPSFPPSFPPSLPPPLSLSLSLSSCLLLFFICSYLFLGLALRHVLDSLKKSPNNKMYLFGLAALDKFKGRLKEFPQYCANIMSIPHFNQFPHVLRQVMLYHYMYMYMTRNF